MKDILTIIVDCDNKVVTCEEVPQDIGSMKFPVETTKSQLIAFLIAPYVSKLMNLSKMELMELSIKWLGGNKPCQEEKDDAS